MIAYSYTVFFKPGKHTYKKPLTMVGSDSFTKEKASNLFSWPNRDPYGESTYGCLFYGIFYILVREFKYNDDNEVVREFNSRTGLAKAEIDFTSLEPYLIEEKRPVFYVRGSFFKRSWEFEEATTSEKKQNASILPDDWLEFETIFLEGTKHPDVSFS